MITWVNFVEELNWLKVFSTEDYSGYNTGCPTNI